MLTLIACQAASHLALTFKLLLGQVLATPIVSALEGTPNAWLGELLGVFNKGDIAGFALLFDARKVGEVGCSPRLKCGSFQERRPFHM
jgi:hypothetical protein